MRFRTLSCRQFKHCLTLLLKSALFVFLVNFVLVLQHDLLNTGFKEEDSGRTNRNLGLFPRQLNSVHQDGGGRDHNVSLVHETDGLGDRRNATVSLFLKKEKGSEDQKPEAVAELRPLLLQEKPAQPKVVVPKDTFGYKPQVLFKKYVAPKDGVVESLQTDIDDLKAAAAAAVARAAKIPESLGGAKPDVVQTKDQKEAAGPQIIKPSEPGKVVPKYKPVHPDCRPLGFAKEPRPITALASFPGSGNTWLRHLLQQATGLYTGSVYGDTSLRRQGFEGESRKDGTVLAVKTHEWPGYGPSPVKPFQKAILLVRDPLETLKSEFNRRNAGHTGHVKENKFSESKWIQFVTDLSLAWFVFNEKWLSFNGSVYVIRYEHLKSHLRESVLDLCEFLGVKVTNEVMECLLHNTEGSQHRRHVEQPLLTVQENNRFLLEIQNRSLFSDVISKCPTCAWNKRLWGS